MNLDRPGKCPPAIIGYLTTKVLMIVLRLLFFIGMCGTIGFTQTESTSKLPTGAFCRTGETEMNPLNLNPFIRA
jgi:hypothetical protein